MRTMHMCIYKSRKDSLSSKVNNAFTLNTHTLDQSLLMNIDIHDTTSRTRATIITSTTYPISSTI